MTDLQLKMASLKAAMSVEVPSHYPEKTKLEMKAGRVALVRQLADSAADEGHKELVRRFSYKAVRNVVISLDEKSGDWIARVVVHTAAKTGMVFEEPLLDFPSDFMIAQIALVA